MRIKMMWLALLSMGCSGKSAEREAWERQIDGVQTVLRHQSAQFVDMDWMQTGRRAAEVVNHRECPGGGETNLFSDDSLEYIDCSMDARNFYDGRIVFDETATTSRFVYEDFHGIMGGYTFRIDGGYNTTDLSETQVRVEADLTMHGDNMEGGEDITYFIADVVFDVEKNTISGSLSMATEYAAGNLEIDTACGFEDEPLDLMVALAKPDFNLFERLCPMSWDEDLKVKIHARHEHDGDEDPIHIMGPDEGFDNGTKVKQGRSDGRKFKSSMGETLQFSVGRGEQVFASATCPASRPGVDFDVVYNDGWGLNTFSFYCVFKGDPPPIPLVE